MGNQFDMQIQMLSVAISASGAENTLKQHSFGNPSDHEARKELFFPG
jgi:hypothetical protein